MAPSIPKVAAVVALQLLVLALVPLRQVRARATGTEVTLETVPVDPRDLLSGHYVTLRYRAEEVAGDLAPALDGEGEAWLVVERGEPAWRAIALVPTRPAPASGRVALRVVREGGRTRIPSAGRFYIPEARTAEVDEALARTGGNGLVDLKVDEDGAAALLRLRVGGLVLGD